MSRRTRQSRGPADWHLWAELTRSVKPLKRRAGPVISEPDKPPARQRPTPKRVPVAAPPSRVIQQPSLAPDPLNKPIEPSVHRKLKRGRLEIDATLDLHGMRQHEAHPALHRFIERCWARGDRNLLIITGKGVKRTGFAAFEQRGVLRHLVPGWLADPALSRMIAGWSASAVPHGGDGALYVRLRRSVR